MSQQAFSSGATKGPNSSARAASLWQRFMLLPQLTVHVAVLMAAGALSAVILALFGEALSSIEERVGALGWTLFPDATLEERITLVVIDELSIAEIGPWPWSREVMARLVSEIDCRCPAPDTRHHLSCV